MVVIHIKRTLFGTYVNGKGSKEIEIRTKELLEDWSPFIRTITSDNGKELANHERIAEGIGIDFTLPGPTIAGKGGGEREPERTGKAIFPERD